MNFKISIIIPVYNSKDYIINCLDSIFSQNQENLEIILVDDGSDDNSSELIKEYIGNHNLMNFHLYKIQHSGQGPARNEGVRRSSGEYIWFVDSDDYIKEGSIKKINSILSSSSPSGIVSTVCVVEQSGERHPNSCLDEVLIDGVYDGKVMFEFLLNNQIVPLCCNKIFNRNVLNGFEFHSDIFFEDVPFNIHLYKNGSTFEVINEDLYVYNQHSTSTMNSEGTEKHLRSIFKSLELSSKYFSEESLGDFIQFYWYQLTFIYLKFVHNSNEAYFQQFVKYFESTKINRNDELFSFTKDQMPLGTLLGSMLEMSNEYGLDDNVVFNSFSFPQSFINTHFE
jgi:glycosyltransferase involved in cell wall biosynthesis